MYQFNFFPTFFTSSSLELAETICGLDALAIGFNIGLLNGDKLT